MISMPRPNWKLKAEYLENGNARLRAALEQIEQWAQAYPLNVFPELDLRKAAQLLAAGGIPLDAISASNMRHVLEGVSGIVREALVDGPS